MNEAAKRLIERIETSLAVTHETMELKVTMNRDAAMALVEYLRLVDHLLVEYEKLRELTKKKPCHKCGTEDGRGCPIYHGMVGDGFCPVFADGQTALEVATEYHNAWLKEVRRNEELRATVERLTRRGLVSRILNRSICHD